MRTKLLSTNHETVGEGTRKGYKTILTYECPCKKGKIIEEQSNLPGDRGCTVTLNCKKCQKKYSLDTRRGGKNWNLIEKATKL